jgi:hypothetical protein
LGREEEGSKGFESEKKKRITDLFSVQELTRNLRKDLFVRTSHSNPGKHAKPSRFYSKSSSKVRS